MGDKAAGSREVRIRPKRRWLRRLALAALLLVGLVVAGHWGLGKVAERRLNEQVAAYRAKGEPMLPAEIARLDADTVGDADNAALVLRAAAASVDTKSDAWQAFNELGSGVDEEDPRPPLADDELKRLRALVASNGAALSGVSDAATKPGVDWQLNLTTPIVLAPLPDLTPQRTLARVLGAAALVAHHDGNDAEALRRVREMLFVGRAIGRQPTLISHMVSLGISSLAAQRVSEIAPALAVSPGSPGDGRTATTKQVQELIAELLDDRPIHEGRKRALRGERAIQLDAATALAYGRVPLDRMMGTGGRTPEQRQRAAAVGGYLIKPIALNDASVMIRFATGFIEAGEADDVYALGAKFPRGPTDEELSSRLHLVARVLMPSYRRVIEQGFRGMANRHAAAVALAARWYALDHDGKLPDRLEDLVPKYLPKVPVDPMARGGIPLAYIPGEDAIVYSVGENGRDDGGTEVPPSASMRERRDKSDEVVHLKRHPRPPKPVEPTPDAPDGPADPLTPPEAPEPEPKP